jgi:hypothetical protein
VAVTTESLRLADEIAIQIALQVKRRVLELAHLEPCGHSRWADCEVVLSVGELARHFGFDGARVQLTIKDAGVKIPQLKGADHAC